MVGGKVINIVQLPDNTWIQVLDATHSESDTCAIRVERNRHIKIGDELWWQGTKAYWTPVPLTGREDVPLVRIGCSHRTIPDDVIEAAYA